MKIKELKALRTKKIDELTKLVSAKKIELTKLAGKMYAGREKNFKKAFNLRKEIAQILTIRKELEKWKFLQEKW